jgi:hypothetical protein
VVANCHRDSPLDLSLADHQVTPNQACQGYLHSAPGSFRIGSEVDFRVTGVAGHPLLDRKDSEIT